jgi:hypothetical protein
VPLMGNGSFDVRVSYGAGLPFTAVPEPPIATPGFAVSAADLNAPPVHATAAGPAPVSVIGLAQSSNPDVAPLATEPTDPFIRVDAQISHTFNGELWDFPFKVTPYLKVINALNRRDAIFYHYNRNAGRAEPLAGLPLMPILGAEWRF